jgi:hypothetical protein
MKRGLLATALLLALATCACGPTLSNDEVIAEVNKCRAAKLNYMILYDDFLHKARSVVCTPGAEDK